jgi:hypothetical protein
MKVRCLIRAKEIFYSASKLPETLVAPKLADFSIENYNLNRVFNFAASTDKVDETEYYFNIGSWQLMLVKKCYYNLLKKGFEIK